MVRPKDTFIGCHGLWSSDWLRNVCQCKEGVGSFIIIIIIFCKSVSIVAIYNTLCLAVLCRAPEQYRQQSAPREAASYALVL